MKGHLSTHILDISTGRPAVGVTIELWRLDALPALHLKSAETNEDGRAELLGPGEMKIGTYELIFKIGTYFGGAKSFLNEVPVRFQIQSVTEGYHVPLLVSPWAYSTYRGN